MARTDFSEITGFAFVNSSCPGDLRTRDAKSTIRRHAMKDVGQARRKRPRARVVELQVRTEKTGSPRLFHSPSPSGILGLDLSERDFQVAYFGG